MAGNVARTVVVRTSNIVGPGVGAGAILLVGAQQTFILTAVLFAVGTSLMFFIKEDFKPIAHEDKQSFMVDLKEGVRTVWHIKWIFALIATTSFQLMFIVGVESVLLPVITRREFETNNVFAVSASVFSLGAIVGALLSLRLKIKHQGQFCILVFALLATTTLALAPSLLLGFAVAASTAVVACFTTVAGIVELTTAEVLVIVLMVFSIKTVIKKDSSGSAVSHRINFDVFVDAVVKCRAY